jgi:hypothetical protein
VQETIWIVRAGVNYKFAVELEVKQGAALIPRVSGNLDRRSQTGLTLLALRLR